VKTPSRKQLQELKHEDLILNVRKNLNKPAAIANKKNPVKVKLKV
jgi:hypothetical protein